MQTAGLILDIYDNPQDLKSIYPSLDVIPEVVKTAQMLSTGELDELPDSTFALVLMNGDARLRKYACVDAGGTQVNVDYFLLHRHKLPLEAQKTAAVNLQTACGWYGLEVPEELEKVALGVNTALTLAMAPSMVKGTGGAIKSNLAAARAVGGQVLPLHHQQQLGQLLKQGEASGTELMPRQDDGDLVTAASRGRPGSSNTSAMKSAAVGHLVKNHGSREAGETLEMGQGVSGEQYQKAPQTPTQALRPHVNVTDKEPPRKLVTKEAQYSAYAEVFPLDNYAQVKQASAYFDANMSAMPPVMRHVFAANMVARASVMGIEFSKEAAAYGSTTFAPEEQLQVGLLTRRPFLNKEASALLDELYENRALLGPDQYCAALEEFDKLAEIAWRYDRAILDPYASTYGVKLASEEITWVNANDYVTKEQIDNFAVTAAFSMRDDYGDDFVKEFQKNPWSTFMSMPLPQKIRIARRASDNSATGMHDVQ